MKKKPSKSLAALAASLDTRKRSLPADSRPGAVALRSQPLPLTGALKARVPAPAAARPGSSSGGPQPRGSSSSASSTRTSTSVRPSSAATAAVPPRPGPSSRVAQGAVPTPGFRPQPGTASASSASSSRAGGSPSLTAAGRSGLPLNRPTAPPPRQRPPDGTPRSTVLESLRSQPRLPPKTTPTALKPAADGDPRRKYPRSELKVNAKLSLADDPSHMFEAALATSNLSVGGLFFESTYFLKMGTVLMVEMQLPPKGRTVKVKGEVVRIETSTHHSGFALRFVEYFDGSEVVLATHFLSPVLREFIVAYAKQHRFDASAEYIAHTADVLAAWELRKAELEGDVWTMGSSNRS
jgi:hypothetical protein